jgi:hypothetical protein
MDLLNFRQLGVREQGSKGLPNLSVIFQTGLKQEI